MIAPDETTFAYLKGRPHAPEGEDWDAAVAYWRTLRTDDDAEFDAEVVIDAAALAPFVTWAPTRPGAPLRRPSPTLLRTKTLRSASPPKRPWSTWGWRPASRCAPSGSTPSS